MHDTQPKTTPDINMIRIKLIFCQFQCNKYMKLFTSKCVIAHIVSMEKITINDY